MIRINPILRTDGYKLVHFDLYPEGTEFVYSYLESRGGKFPEVVCNGMKYYMNLLSEPFNQDDIEEADEVIADYFGVKDTRRFFYRDGFEYILKEYGGHWPLRVKSLLEGTVLPYRNIMMSLENTDKKCWWVTNYVEPVPMKIWYPSTVASLDREIKKIILQGLVKSGTPALIDYMLHDFGYRGASSEESSMLAGTAHAINFKGSDTLPVIPFIRALYGDRNVIGSIPATEHSIMYAKGENGEVEQMRRFLLKHGDSPVPAIACVSDTYNIFRACEEYWGGELKNMVINLGNKVLGVRPDSGDPPVIVCQVAETLEKAFGTTINEKGYKVLNHVRIVQGDGVNKDSIQDIINALHARNFSLDNIGTFGMGGALHSMVNRDTNKFAIKASSYIINGRRFDYQKNPITDSGKRSKVGRLKLIKDEGIYTTVADNIIGHDELMTVYENGTVFYNQTFAEIRQRAELPIPELLEA